MVQIGRLSYGKCYQMSKKNPLFHNGEENEVIRNSYARVITFPCLPSLVDVSFRVRQLSYLQNYNRRNVHITSALLAEVMQIFDLCRTSRVTRTYMYVQYS